MLGRLLAPKTARITRLLVPPRRSFHQRTSATSLYKPELDKGDCGLLSAVKPGPPSHHFVKSLLSHVDTLNHRVGMYTQSGQKQEEGSETCIGDGFGLLSTPLPHTLLEQTFDTPLPKPGHYGVGNLFLSQDESVRRQEKEAVNAIASEQGLTVLGWKPLPVNKAAIPISLQSKVPVMEHVFFESKDPDKLETQLFYTHLRSEHELRSVSNDFYVMSMSSRLFILKYEGMPKQVLDFYPYLSDPTLFPLYEAKGVFTHGRKTTNTLGDPKKAHFFPYSGMGMNGEINSLPGYSSWFRSLPFTKFPDKVRAAIGHTEGNSDTQVNDKIIGALIHSDMGPGLELDEAMVMTHSSPTKTNKRDSEEVLDMSIYNKTARAQSTGPAAIQVCDGRKWVTFVDEKGFRPQIFTFFKDGSIMSGSEAVPGIDPATIMRQIVLSPGRVFSVDVESGYYAHHNIITERLACKFPYGNWRAERPKIDPKRPFPIEEALLSEQDSLFSAIAGGSYRDQLDAELGPIIQQGKIPSGCMGERVSHPLLSEHPLNISRFIRENHVNVTAPSADVYREKEHLCLSRTIGIGPDENSPQPRSKQVQLQHAVLTPTGNDQLVHHLGSRIKTIDLSYPKTLGPEGYKQTEDTLVKAVLSAVQDGHDIIYLDEHIDETHLSVDPLTIVPRLHTLLTQEKKRHQCSLLVKSLSPNILDVPKLISFGAEGVYPIGMYSLIPFLKEDGQSLDDGIQNIKAASNEALMRAMSRMGITVFQSYKGSHSSICDGFDASIHTLCFPTVPCSIGGITYRDIGLIKEKAHDHAYSLKHPTK